MPHRGGRVELRGDADFFEHHVQRGHLTSRLQAGGQANICERAIDEATQALQAPIEHRTRGASERPRGRL